MKIVSQDSFLGGGGVKGVESTNVTTNNRFATPQTRPQWLPNSFGETVNDAMQIMPNVGTSGFNAYNRSMDILENPNFNPAQKFMGVAGAGMMGASNMIGDVVLGIGKMGISQEKEDEIKQIVGETAAKVIDTPEAQSILKWYKGLDEDDKLFVDSAGGALSFMLDVGTFGAGKSITAPAKELLSKATKLPGKAYDAGKTKIRGMGRPGGGGPPPPPGGAGQLAAPALEVLDATAEAGAKATSNVVGGSLGEFASRLPRAIARGVDAIDEASARAARIAASSPVVQSAIKSNLADDLINFTQTADEATVKDARKMLDIAESTPTNLIPKQNPGDVAGQAAAKQYQIVESQKRIVGQKIGDLSDDLAKQGVRVDMKPAYRQAVDILRANGMLPKVSGKIKFDTKKYTPQQQDVIQKLYNLAMQEKVMSPTQVHEMDQLFSKLQRELLENGKVSDVYVKVPSSKGTVEINIFKVFREIFSEHLSKLSPELKLANAEYRKYKNIVDDIEATLVKKGNLKTNADVNPAEYARTNLRRIFSDAASSADYKAIYNKLDTLSRELGYKGSRADTLSLLASKLRDLYPDTIPKNSFQGGIQTGLRGFGVMDLAEKVLKTGTPDVRDQQRALRALLEDRANFGFKQVEAPVPKTPETPTAKSEPESLVDDTTPDEIPEEAIVDTAKKIQRDLRNNPQGGYFNIVEMIKDVIGLGKRAKGAIRRKPESKMDREFRRKDEVYWESKGYRTTGDGRIEKNNRNRGMANFGAMAEDIAGVFKKKVADPTIRTKRAVDVKTVSGEKVSIPEGTVLNPMVDGSKVSISVNGKEVVMPKNQYQNLVGQSDRAIATPFAPELKETIETVLGDSIAYKNKQSIYFDDSRWGEGKVEIIAQDLDQRGFGNGEFTVWEGDKKLGDSMLYDEAVQFAKDHIDNSYPNATVDLTGLKADVKPQNTKYSSYTLPGGENYREILIQAPVQKGDISSAQKALDELKKDGITLEDEMDGNSYPIKDGEAVEYDELTPRQQQLLNTVTGNAENTEGLRQNIAGKAMYISSHYPDDPNPLFHLRMNERTIKTANDTTFMEELQSDWAREGREKGFAKTYTELPEWVKPKETQAMGGVYKYEFDLPEGGKVQFNSSRDKATVKKDALKALNGSEADGIPNHPLLKNWQIPAVKRALMEAVDNKSNYFAWINGEQTSARYNLATHLEEAVWEKIKDSRIGDIRDKAIELVPKSGGESIIINIDNTGTITKTGGRADGDWKGKKLDEVLGKGLADKIMEKETGTLSGEGLKFGGEWAENLYDKQVANIVKKLTGAEVKTVDLGLPVANKKPSRFIKQSGRDAGGSVSKNDLKVGLEINEESFGDLVITEVLENGKFRAIPKTNYNSLKEKMSLGRMNELLATNDFDLNSTRSAVQQYIELTPEVKAKIQSKAPSFSMKIPSVGESLPLLLLMLGGATYAGNQ